MSTDDTMLDELLGAYALDAVEPDEAVAVEAYLERSPGAADEVARLRKAAAWIGATEALAPPPALHDTVLDAVRARRGGRHDAGDDPFLAVYLSEAARLDALLDEVPESLERPHVQRPDGARARHPSRVDGEHRRVRDREPYRAGRDRARRRASHGDLPGAVP